MNHRRNSRLILCLLLRFPFDSLPFVAAPILTWVPRQTEESQMEEMTNGKDTNGRETNGRQ